MAPEENCGSGSASEQAGFVNPRVDPAAAGCNQAKGMGRGDAGGWGGEIWGGPGNFDETVAHQICDGKKWQGPDGGGDSCGVVCWIRVRKITAHRCVVRDVATGVGPDGQSDSRRTAGVKSAQSPDDRVGRA